VSENLRTNPFAVRGAPEPLTGYYPVNGTNLYAEVRGSGPVVLLIGAADEDAEIYRPVAERLDGYTVVTYDRRGTLRSGREDWPGGGSVQHADDAAGLLEILGLRDVTVLGTSAGGIVALALALRYPHLVGRALVFEPGCFYAVPGGEQLLRRVDEAVTSYLAAHPDDWKGARATLGRTVVASLNPDSRGLFSPPEGMDWYTQRFDANAEALIRGDFELTREPVDENELASSPVDIEFSYGGASLPIFSRISTHLAEVRGGTPSRLDGVGHLAFYHPDAIASYILSQGD
jgi:pimeloyl-ACP methyl ester carboxylesterase